MSKTRYPPGSVWVSYQLITGWVDEQKQYERRPMYIMHIDGIPEHGLRRITFYSATATATDDFTLHYLDKQDLRPATRGKWAMAVMKGRWEPGD